MKAIGNYPRTQAVSCMGEEMSLGTRLIGNVMLELGPGEMTMANMLCIEDSKVCAVYLWNIQDESQYQTCRGVVKGHTSA